MVPLSPKGEVGQAMVEYLLVVSLVVLTVVGLFGAFLNSLFN